MILLAANNAQSNLAGSISSTATSVNLTPGTGILFPSPQAGQYFVATFVDAATGLLREIVHVTAVSGDTMTIVRAQEGTNPLAWNAGDLFLNQFTAGSLAALSQPGELYADDTGGVNALAIALPVALSSLSVGTVIYVNPANTTTSAAPTLSVNGSGPTAITTSLGNALPIGQIVEGIPTPIMVGPAGAFWSIAPIQQATTFSGGTSTGSANAQAVAVITPPSFSLTSGYSVIFTPGFTNTGATTLAIAGTMATACNKVSGGSLVAFAGGEFTIGDPVTLTFNGTVWVLQTSVLGALAFLNTSTFLTSVGGNANVSLPSGQCYLGYVGATELLLSPINGGALWINGINYAIPASLQVSNSGLSASTKYYVYAFINSGTMTLEAVATAYTLAANGIPQKTGDPSRTLVGVATTNGSAQFEASGVGTFSYFHQEIDPPFAQVWGTPGTYTFVSPGFYTELWGEVCGSGAGGSGNQSGFSGSSGGAGGTARGWFPVTPGQSITFTVPSGGQGSSAGSAGNAGATGSIGSIMQATGAAAPASGILGGAPGVGSGGTENYSGGWGSDGSSTSVSPGIAGVSFYGGGAKGVPDSTSTALGAPGSGGGGGAGSGGYGANGSPGQIIIRSR